MTSPYIPLTIRAIRPEAPDTKSFVLEPPAGTVLPYQPGQYLTLVHTRHGQEARRSYSISSAPALHEPLTITVKRVDNGVVSRYLIDQAQPGDELHTLGAAGFFTLPDDISSYQQLILLAAGSGITPLFSVLKTVLHAVPQLRVLLVYSNRNEASTIFGAELRELARRFPSRLHLEMLFSTDPNLARAHLHKELLEQLVAHYAPGPPAATLAYLCGPLNYMRMGTYGLHEAGLPLSHIRRELFNTATATVPHSIPPDTEAHEVRIRVRGQEHTLRVQYPQTILQAAKQQGLVLPYSCEAGQCGNCAARCTAGTVWMANNEVLTDRETARGLVLTCTGYPVGGDAALEI
ncbi:ferredoxin--NADP reductase [Hymenobacter chitinivorans]|uniref:Ring-1,2-phenylacetyl-CoA epoxidase subunit PaaE n=1 Tax=Hymenobacter chitinivorans DSM 11115 TaxID=1121954 RepID=A0A2M9B903_9BACT|nr:ferredoxin--NADP reductase [Hymenobacter chitinivorans]PJJ54430.1 ring-1,2-phenylacetyl-CoA epoxidase subunit PaaE [Hymenobacter chitinivorans DSM 11115]